jgi:site-specific recombinase XerD
VTELNPDKQIEQVRQRYAAAAQQCSTRSPASCALAAGSALPTFSPPTLRHSTAMRLLRAGVDTTVIALWLGHESVATTQIYINPRELHQTGVKPLVAW